MMVFFIYTHSFPQVLLLNVGVLLNLVAGATSCQPWPPLVRRFGLPVTTVSSSSGATWREHGLGRRHRWVREKSVCACMCNCVCGVCVHACVRACMRACMGAVCVEET